MANISYTQHDCLLKVWITGEYNGIGDLRDTNRKATHLIRQTEPCHLILDLQVKHEFSTPIDQYTNITRSGASALNTCGSAFVLHENADRPLYVYRAGLLRAMNINCEIFSTDHEALLWIARQEHAPGCRCKNN